MTIDDAPTRATWTVQPPAGPWCPPEWLQHLHHVAPGFTPPDASLSQHEAAIWDGERDAWQLAAASRRGRLHAHRGEHREDAAAVSLLAGGGWCAAVADGAGSAEYSRIGAALAVFTATNTCAGVYAHRPPEGVPLDGMLNAVSAATHEALRGFAGLAGIAPRTLRTTLLLAVCRDDLFGFAHVGDGGIVLLHGNGEASMPTLGHAGDFSGEVAHFLPDDGAVEAMLASVTLRPAHDVAGLMLASDGVEDAWYPMTRNAPALFTQLVHGVTDVNAEAAGVMQPMRGHVLGHTHPAAALANWLAFEKRGENDDRTLLVARQHGVTWPSSR